MILVDTSVWVDHLSRGLLPLTDLLEAGDVVTHPFIIGELACGRIQNRGEVLDLLRTLPSAPVAVDDEVLLTIDKHRLWGRGLGYIDAHLLASAMLANDLQLWTRDKRLRSVASTMRLDFAEA